MCLVFSIIASIIAFNFFVNGLYLNASFSLLIAFILLFLMYRNIVSVKKRKGDKSDN